jgi:hypothetical protein
VDVCNRRRFEGALVQLLHEPIRQKGESTGWNCFLRRNNVAHPGEKRRQLKTYKLNPAPSRNTCRTQFLADVAANQTKHNVSKVLSADQRESVAIAFPDAIEVQPIVRTKGSVAMCLKLSATMNMLPPQSQICAAFPGTRSKRKPRSAPEARRTHQGKDCQAAFPEPVPYELQQAGPQLRQARTPKPKRVRVLLRGA